jgi:hypothetical protein
MFGASIKFNIKNDTYYKSLLGGTISLIYLILVICLMIYKLVQFASRNNKNLVFNNKVQDPLPINLTDMQYTFSLGLIDDELGNSVMSNYSKYFDVNFYFVKLDGFGNQTIKSKIPIKLKKCEVSDFYGDYNKINDQTFNNLQLSEFICPYAADFSQYNLTGLFTDNIFHYFELTLSLRVDKLDKMQEIEKLNNKNPAKLIIYSKDSFMNFDDFDNPIKGNMAPFMYYLNFKTYKKLSLQLSTLFFASDDNIMWSNPEVGKYILLESLSLDEININERKLDPSVSNYLNFFSVNFFVTGKIFSCQRTYQKFTEYLADLTGLLSSIGLILLFVLFHINDVGAKQKVLHRLMKFEGNKNFDKDLLLKVFTPVILKVSDNLVKDGAQLKKGSKSNAMIEEDLNPLPDDKSKMGHSKTSLYSVKTNSYKLRIESIISSKKKIKISKLGSCAIFLSTIFCCIKTWKDNRGFIDQVGDKFQHYLDIFTYFKKMIQIDNLKYLVLNKHQVNLFNFISSPNITKNFDSSELKNYFEEEYRKKISLNREEIFKINESYEKLINPEIVTEFNTKLIQLFMQELNTVKNE